ncbi:hypothetical protein EG329_009838 [Mollisiaceae sp. DMI_Dod_QoI]|nr:hypothetical protein EG329_009838 [Helotiales sp. DMI_Dod_QoI]
MRSVIFSAAVALATGVSAAPAIQTATTQTSFADTLSYYLKGFQNPRIDTSTGGQATCISGAINVTASAKNFNFSMTAPVNQTELTQFLVNGISANSTSNKDLLVGLTNVTGSYGIYSQLCFPNNTTKLPSTVQFLTHGLGCDRSYWNLAPNYSYIDAAAEHGSTTFLYDRLGVGLSDHPDPIQIVQGGLEGIQIAIAHELVQSLRAGDIADHAFKHVVGVGHSYGSFQTHGVTRQHPKDFDAVVLTGFSKSTAGMLPGFAAVDLTIASQEQPLRFADLPSGYVTGSGIQGTQFAFFHAPGFDPALLNLAEATKQSITIGEYLSNPGFGNVTEFTGPIDVVNGEFDLMNCDGNCLYPDNLAATFQAEFYPNASNGSSWYLGPDSGHFLNHHYAAAGAYEHIQNFVKKNGF